MYWFHNGKLIVDSLVTYLIIVFFVYLFLKKNSPWMIYDGSKNTCFRHIYWQTYVTITCDLTTKYWNIIQIMLLFTSGASGTFRQHVESSEPLWPSLNKHFRIRQTRVVQFGRGVQQPDIALSPGTESARCAKRSIKGVWERRAALRERIGVPASRRACGHALAQTYQIGFCKIQEAV